jgi:hypothetical protein
MSVFYVSSSRTGLTTSVVLLHAFCLSCIVSIEKEHLAAPDAAADEGNDEDNDEAIIALTAEEYCATYFDAFCLYLSGCCTSGERDNDMMAMLFPVPMDDCTIPSTSSIYTDCVVAVSQSVVDGMIILDGASFPGCREALTQTVSGCPNLGVFWQLFTVTWKDHCSDMIIGLVDQGSVCSEGSNECRQGLYCTEDTCMPTASPGEECDSDAQCGPGTTCFGSPVLSCLPPAQIDEPCVQYYNCDTGLYCESDTNRCTLQFGPGSLCTFTDLMDRACEGMCLIDEGMTDGECQDFCNGI